MQKPSLPPPASPAQTAHPASSEESSSTEESKVAASEQPCCPGFANTPSPPGLRRALTYFTPEVSLKKVKLEIEPLDTRALLLQRKAELERLLRQATQEKVGRLPMCFSTCSINDNTAWTRGVVHVSFLSACLQATNSLNIIRCLLLRCLLPA